MNISSSIRRLTQLFVALFIALSGGLVYWQVVVADQVTSNIHNSRQCLYENSPKRGNIYDRNGVLLATSIKNPNRNGCGYIRKYTDPSLAGLIGYYASAEFPATGLEAAYNDVLDGQTGSSELNNTVNHLLHRGPVGDNIYLTIDERVQKIVDKDFDTPTPDSDFTNPGVINDPSGILNDGMTDGGTGDLLYNSDRGSVVVSDPHTGEMLAMLSRPYFDPNKMVQTLSVGDTSYYSKLVIQSLENPLVFRPTQSLYIPGSIFKTVTLMAGIDSGTTTLTSNWSQQQAYGNNGVAIIDGTQVSGDNLGYRIGAGSYTFHFPISTIYGYEESDNILFANLGLNIGQNTWLNYANKLYMGQKVPFDLPVATSSVLDPSDNGSLNQYLLAANAFGQGHNQVTPLQMSLIDNTVANNGVMMQPYLVSKVTDSNNDVVSTTDAKQLNNVISADSATKVRSAMYAMIKCGGGYPILPLRNTQWGIIGKTGTAEVGGSQAAEAWMITEGPYYDNNTSKMPALSIVAMKENAGEGGNAVGPMIAQMYSDIFSQGLISNVQQPQNQTASTYCQANNLWQSSGGR